MKQGWEIKKLGEICSFINGRAYSKHELLPHGKYPVLRVGNFFTNNQWYYSDLELNDDKYCDNGDLLYAWSASFGPQIWNGEKVIYHYHIWKVIPNINQISKEFLYKLLFWDTEAIKSAYGTGTTMMHVSKGSIENRLVPLPPLPEQQRIVSILDKAFAAIDKAKANAEQNLKNAKEVFESYLQGVFENGNWEEKKWGELCEFVRGPFGGSLKKNIFKKDGFVVYEQKHAIHDHFNQLRYFIDEEKFNEMRRFELFAGDIIMSCSGVTLGRVAIVPVGIKRGIINQALLKLTPKKNVNVHFIKHWLRSNIFQKIIFDYSAGAAIPNVPAAKILKEILIPCPSLKEQERIVNEVEIILNKAQKLEAIYQQKLVNLEKLKKSLLEKAYSGEL